METDENVEVILVDDLHLDAPQEFSKLGTFRDPLTFAQRI
jgi:hypothetical protein